MRWKNPFASEHQEQMAVIQWADAMGEMLPEASLIFAIPNGGLRPKKIFRRGGKIANFSVAGKKLKQEGARAGIPDLFLPVARQEWHGLFIEMKSAKGITTLDQDIWIALLTAQKYAVCVCWSSDEAIKAIKGYLVNPAWSPQAFKRIHGD